MKVKKLSLVIVFVLALITSIQAREQIQNGNILNSAMIARLNIETEQFDSTKVLSIDSLELNTIKDLRTVFEKQNQSYSTPKAPGNDLLRFLKKDELEISNEAMYWARMIRDASYYFDNYVTFRDTIIVDPIFLPIVFKGNHLKEEDLTFYSMDFTKSKYQKKPLYEAENPFEDYLNRKKSEDLAINHVVHSNPSYIRYSEQAMPGELLQTKTIKKVSLDDVQIKVESEADFSDVAPVKFIPERRYWISGFESAVQFSQNYLSNNWYKGGSSNLNLFTKNVLSYNYSKNKIHVNNQIEYKTSVSTVSKDEKHDYRVQDELLRLHNNIGYKAFNRWSYTFDTDVQTQILTNYKENSDQRQAAFLAPVMAKFGVGMKYDLKKQFKNKHNNVNLGVNIAPLTLQYLYSRITDPEKIDLGRHSVKFKKGDGEDYRGSYTELGSSVDATMTYNFSRLVIWQSRLSYFTTYHNTKTEFENTLILGIGRFFTTRINLNLRFDDGSDKKDPDLKYVQINQLLSFGFNYKW